VDAPGDRGRWAVLALALTALAALIAYGLRQPAPDAASLWALHTAPARWAGRDFVIDSVRVAELLPGGRFVGEAGGYTAVFRGAPDVTLGESLTVRAAIDPASGELELKAARSLPRGMRVLRGVILLVSVAVLLVVAANVVRRFRWIWPAGLSRREEGAGWRTS
jgi:hypothetical protein